MVAVAIRLCLAIVAGSAAGLVAQDARIQDWRLVERARIGSVNDPELALTAVTGGLLGSAGQIHLLQPMDRGVRVYSPEPRLLRRLGGAGSGPGEFTGPVRMGWWKGDLYVVDRAAGRIALFASSGELVNDWRPPIRPPEGQEIAPVPEALLPDGRVLVNGRRSVGSGDGGDVPELYFVVDSTGSMVGTPIEISRRNLRFAIRNPDAPVFGYFGGQPFPDSPLMAVDPRGRFLVVAERSVESLRTSATRATVHLHRIGGTADTAWSLILHVETTSIPVAVRDSAVAAIWERVEIARGPGMSTRQKRRALMERLYLPEVFPPIDEVVVDYDGNIWLRRSNRSPGPVPLSQWIVVGPAGRVVARAVGPPGMSLLDQRGGTVIGVVKDELDVDYVLVMTKEQRR